MNDYIPEVGDYVIWDKGIGDKDEGWVYFKTGDLVEERDSNRNQSYITIETGIRPRPICETEEKLNPKMRSPRHKYIHTLLLCFESNYHELKYIHSRPNCKSTEYFRRTF